MRNRMVWLLVMVTPWGCHSPQNPAAAPHPVVQLTDYDDYPRYIGQRVEVVGEVTNTKCPQVCGIEAWELSGHSGKRVRLRGTLREYVVTQESLDEYSRKGIAFANRGAGRFYLMDGLEFEMLP